MKGFVAWLMETPRFMQGMMSGAVVGMLAIGVLQVVPTAGALSLESKRDCNDNAVVHCGALSTSEVQERYSQSGVAAIYDYFGIKAAHINSIATTATAGQVTKDGKVLVHGKIVATGAMTAGRQNIPGSAKITHKGATFYARPPRVSFKSSPLAAFVVMKDGQFSYAILASCGNPVTANAVKPVKPTPPTPPTPTPTTPEQPAPTPPPAQPAAVVTQTKLPETGPTATAAITGVATIAGTAGFYLFQRRRVRQLAGDIR